MYMFPLAVDSCLFLDLHFDLFTNFSTPNFSLGGLNDGADVLFPNYSQFTYTNHSIHSPARQTVIPA